MNFFKYTGISIILLFCLQISNLAASNSQQAKWLHVKIGLIGAASDDILNAALDRAIEQELDGLLIELDTPGGALDHTRKMVQNIMSAPLPVVVWVGPSGAHAGSAGAFITLAAHVASMASGTNIGAAHPIQASGQDVEEGEAQRKMMNDTIAFIESIAETRGRNIEMARSFVATSTSITASEALKHNIIDFIEPNIDSLMKSIHTREITLQNGLKRTISSSPVTFIEFETSLRQKALEILSNPNLFYLLFMAGLVGIGYELTHPGAMFPGIVGGICIILAFIAMAILPVSIGAAALILLGVALLVAEAFVTSFGILGISGFISFVLGSIFLVDPNNEQGLRISLWTIAPGSVIVGLAFLALGILIVRSTNEPIHSGGEAMIGKTGKALQDFTDNSGQIRVAGAIWSAKIAETTHVQSSDLVTVQSGDLVTVQSIDGLTLTITKNT